MAAFTERAKAYQSPQDASAGIDHSIEPLHVPPGATPAQADMYTVQGPRGHGTNPSDGTPVEAIVAESQRLRAQIQTSQAKCEASAKLVRSRDEAQAMREARHRTYHAMAAPREAFLRQRRPIPPARPSTASPPGHRRYTAEFRARA